MVETKFLAGIDRQWRINIAATHQFQARGRDADDRGGHSVKRDRAADEGRVRCETALPQAFAYDGDRRSTGLFFVCRELTASDELGSEYMRQSRADVVSGELFGLTISTQSECGEAHSGELLERLCLFAPGKKVQYGGGESG